MKSSPAITPRRSPPESRSPAADAFAYRIGDACTMVGIGRTSLYELVKLGQLKLVKVAGRSLIDGDSLRSLIRAA